MEALINVAVELLRLIPLILVFYIPALLGTVIWKERGESYRIKAAIWFVLGFAGIAAIHLTLRSASALQIVETVSLSLVQFAAALALAALTVYKLAD